LSGRDLLIKSHQEFGPDLDEQVPEVAVNGAIPLCPAPIPVHNTGDPEGVFSPFEEHALKYIQFRRGEQIVHCSPFAESKDQHCRSTRGSNTPRASLSAGQIRRMLAAFVLGAGVSADAAQPTVTAASPRHRRP
jgi:hypothetical protein